ncbi:hypothetical protein CP532_3324 [Ophiocordyceps camponoti-leonardi (nom. inval.)]|nr:hypothetical protein CP532_3324 [Ophiocordyceps camponoti-leonardi (nom. inval.)]
MADPMADNRSPDQAPRNKAIQPHGRSRAVAQPLDAAPSICRICRGEGTASEPLFYPCKCSGSIKYVHQDCLMEWLSHSQKKYCELCKTSFRFTKLYAHDMPKSLPVHVFVKHMGRYLLRNLLTWLRAIVTISVWACWLPYFMRSVWSFMFWVSDEGLGGASILSRNNDTDATAFWLSGSNNSCPASPLWAATTTSAAEAAAMFEGLDSEDLSDYLLRILFGSLGMPMKVGRHDARAHYNISNLSSADGHSFSATTTSPSLLGNVQILHNLTRSPTLNRTVVTVLEGQVITVLVIICFILVILVRDYVVQQQPEINMRAAFGGPGNELHPEGHNIAQAAAVEPPEQPHRPDTDDEVSDNADRTLAAPLSGASPGDDESIPDASNAIDVEPATSDQAFGATNNTDATQDIPAQTDNRMRGPIAGLFQNAIFCAVLVSVTIFACIFIPYNTGRITFWIVANPMQVVRIFFEISKVVQDAVVMLGGLSSWFVLHLLDMLTSLVGGPLAAKIATGRKASWGLWTGAGTRVMDYALLEFPISASEMHNFSAISHEALNTVKKSVASVLGTIDSCTAFVMSPSFYAFDRMSVAATASAFKSVAVNLQAALSIIFDPGSWVIDLSRTEARAAADPDLAYWPGIDRFWAILAGYLTIFAMGALYLRRGTPFSRNNVLQAWEAGIIDTLHQASGIMKVIVIISIEMLVFPLYCGLLLDAALLPLFENTTIKSRILFSYNFPLTSIFVHWFVGTGYMFHFALFVSMCRKIMRPGVLYFIRDPDDPEFHPIRDVLERSLTTQLRKILFSAFVYGALVIVCLGGVVWSLSYALPGVLPIHYSSNEPVLEFPVDLLFYNFLMPQAVKVLRPGDGLHTMYTWWFRKCARGLRLTFFLFGERRIDEEGTLQLGADTAGSIPRYRKLFLELSDQNEVVPKTWRDTFEGGDAKPNRPLSSREERQLRRRKQHLVTSGQLLRSGRFVRAPASDRVNIPKGKPVLLPVTELGRRKDGETDHDIYASDQYQMVYTPPNFRLRIFLFILLIWLFAAVTGVGITIAPLALGRKMFKLLIPEHIRTNDIYAFSIGIYVLGTASYTIICVKNILADVRAWARKTWTDVIRGHALRHASSGIVRGAKLMYAYMTMLIIFPLLSSTLMELYVTIPLHTYMNPPSTASVPKVVGDGGRHTIRVIQAWTLGLLYMNLGTRMVSSLFPESRAALAVRVMMRRGWLRPDVGILTRAFVIPGLATAAIAIFGPPMMASFLIRMELLGNGVNATEIAGAGELTAIYRHSYPAAALAVLVVDEITSLFTIHDFSRLRCHVNRAIRPYPTCSLAMAEPPSSPPGEATSAEDALSWYKSQYELLESELAEFRESSRELEKELEKDIERAEKQERVFQERAEALGFEVEEWKRKHREAKTEASAVQAALEKEITTLRDSNRSLQLRLRDIEVANDDFERQARNTSSSLEDMESKYNQAIERGVMMEEEIKSSEQEREQLRIDSQRLREELADLKIEAELMQDKIKKHEARHLSTISTDLSVLGSPVFDKHPEESPDSAASSPLVTTPPEVTKARSRASDVPDPPSPPMSDASAPVRNANTTSRTTTTTTTTTTGKTTDRPPRKSRLPSLDGNATPKPRSRPSMGTAPTTAPVRPPGSRASGVGAVLRTPSNRPPKTRPTAAHKISTSNSLSHIRSLTAQMQRLEARVQSARSKLPAPASSSSPRASPRGSSLGQHMPSTVTIRNRRRAVASSASSMAGDEDATPTNARATTSNHSHRARTRNEPAEFTCQPFFSSKAGFEDRYGAPASAYVTDIHDRGTDTSRTAAIVDERVNSQPFG